MQGRNSNSDVTTEMAKVIRVVVQTVGPQMLVDECNISATLQYCLKSIVAIERTCHTYPIPLNNQRCSIVIVVYFGIISKDVKIVAFKGTDVENIFSTANLLLELYVAERRYRHLLPIVPIEGEVEAQLYWRWIW